MTERVLIAEIRVSEAVVPPRPEYVDSPQLADYGGARPWYELPRCLVEVVFSDGVVGLTELSSARGLPSVIASLRSLLGREIAGPQLKTVSGMGERVEPGAGYAGLDTLFPPASRACAAAVSEPLAIALLDAAGKRLGCRVVDLLGGACRERLPVDGWCSRRTPEDLAQTVKMLADRGFRGVKIKSRLGDPIVEQARAVREAGGECFSLTIDPMFQWLTPEHVLSLIRPLEALGMKIRIEDPFPQDQPDFWRRWQSASSIPLAWHARGADALRRGLQERCAEVFNCTGSTRETLAMAHAVELLGYPCWFGSGIELGVMQVARMHAAAAARACVLPCDFVSGFVREHTLMTWDWPYRDGFLPLPQGPGLGIELDRDALRHYMRHEEVLR